MAGESADCIAKRYSSIDELRADYERDGLVSIKGLIPVEKLEAVQRDFTETFAEFAPDKQFPIDSAIIELNKTDKQLLYELHMATTKLISLRSLFSLFADVVVDLTSSQTPVYEISGGYLLGISKDKRLVYDFHQESNYMREFSSIFNFHFPLLRKSSQQNGTMSVLRGSHKIGTVSFEKSV